MSDVRVIDRFTFSYNPTKGPPINGAFIEVVIANDGAESEVVFGVPTNLQDLQPVLMMVTAQVSERKFVGFDLLYRKQDNVEERIIKIPFQTAEEGKIILNTLLAKADSFANDAEVEVARDRLTDFIEDNLTIPFKKFNQNQVVILRPQLMSTYGDEAGLRLCSFLKSADTIESVKSLIYDAERGESNLFNNNRGYPAISLNPAMQAYMAALKDFEAESKQRTQKQSPEQAFLKYNQAEVTILRGKLLYQGLSDPIIGTFCSMIWECTSYNDILTKMLREGEYLALPSNSAVENYKKTMRLFGEAQSKNLDAVREQAAQTPFLKGNS